MSPHDQPADLLRRTQRSRHIAALCAALMLLVAALSAYLRLDKAGLGCEPWPSCYGQALRESQRGAEEPPGTAKREGAPVVAREVTREVALARLAHRLVASAALVWVIVLLISLLTTRPRPRGRLALAWGLLALALFLSALGLRTGASRLPAVALGNLLGGVAMLALAWRLAAPAKPTPDADDARLSRWTAWALIVLVVQLVLGGLVSTSFAALSCTDLVDCARRVAELGWPWRRLDPWLEPVFATSTRLPINPGGSLAQLLHLGWAFVVSAFALAVCWQAFVRGHVRTALGFLLLLVLQLNTGLWSLTPALPLSAALMHNLIAALQVALLTRLV
jgi:cytochrome c oxidase assembly protein subunit 15